jgi:16S rRNA (guanine1207-N2)-methyltransferase
VTEPDHYFAPRPATRSSRRQIVVDLPDGPLPLTTDAAVFSGDRVDPGTRLLLVHGPDPPSTGDVLDLGCGYGPIALALARRAPGATVWAIDVNQRALGLCAENARALGLGNVRCARPEDVPAEVRFASVWSNPPIRIGKAALHDLLAVWLARLDEGGGAHFVVSRHLGADSLARWLVEQGYRVERRASHRGYRLLDVTPP